MAKSSKDRDRRAKAEEIRKQQAAKERRRTLLVLLACVLVGAVVVGFAVVKYADTKRKQDRNLDAIGAASATTCQPVTRKNAEGGGQHEDPGTTINYPDSPPAFGKHWGNFLQGPEIKNYYTADDRPEIERLVHSLEHGYTILWYDQTIADDPSAVADLKSIANKYPVGDRLIIAPWTKNDGGSFADDAHVVLTHWTGPDNQQGIWQYCTGISGSAVEKFTKDFPAANAPEPGAV